MLCSGLEPADLINFKDDSCFIANIFDATFVGGNFVFIKCVVVGVGAGLTTADG